MSNGTMLKLAFIVQHLPQTSTRQAQLRRGKSTRPTRQAAASDDALESIEIRQRCSTMRLAMEETHLT